MIKLTPEKAPYYENVTQTKKYVALLTQNGSDNPTAIILKNTLGGTITWTRQSTGVYNGTLTNAFSENKTTVMLSNTGSTNSIIAGYYTTADTVQIITGNGGIDSDSVLSGTPIEITIYQ